jgi:hypothetical protein
MILKIYTTLVGVKIAGEEISEDDTFLHVRGASYLDMDAAHTKFNFHALEFVTPEHPLPIRKTAIMFESSMPPVIAERFSVYLKQLDLDAEKRKLES